MDKDETYKGGISIPTVLPNNVGICTSIKGTYPIHGRVQASDSIDTYTGDYTVRSQVDADYELATAQKYLSKNITVEKIPYYETSNLADGLTVYIGKEIEVNYG